MCVVMAGREKGREHQSLMRFARPNKEHDVRGCQMQCVRRVVRWHVRRNGTLPVAAGLIAEGRQSLLHRRPKGSELVGQFWRNKSVGEEDVQ